jgi:hypothetical protein
MSSPRVNYGDIPIPSQAPPNQVAPVVTSGQQYAQVSGVSFKNISLVGGVHVPASPDEVMGLERFSINEGIKMALQNAIVTAPDGLIVRPFIPDVDFEDGNGNAITIREWLQPWSGTYMNVSAASDVTIYTTSNDTRYDRKVYVFWGLSYVNIGNQRSASAVDTASIIFTDGANNTYDIWNPQPLDTNSQLIAFAPIIYPNTRVCKIKFRAKYAASGAFESIMLLGRVIEPEGDNVQGARMVHA